jgi:hypothetical protein
VRPTRRDADLVGVVQLAGGGQQTFLGLPVLLAPTDAIPPWTIGAVRRLLAEAKAASWARVRPTIGPMDPGLTDARISAFKDAYAEGVAQEFVASGFLPAPWTTLKLARWPAPSAAARASD